MLFLIACTSDPGTSDDDTAASTCDTTISETWPSDGAQNFYHRDSISFTLTAEDSAATVIADFDGTQTVSEDGLTITYAPTEPLAPSTDYTVSLDYCHGVAPISFGTSALGEDLDAGLSLEGLAWSFELGDMHYIEPENLGDLAAQYFTEKMLLGVASQEGTELVLRVAVGYDGGDTQDYCGRTFEVGGVALDGAYFATDTLDLEFEAYGTTFHIYDTIITGTFSSDGTLMGGGTVTGVLDGNDLAEAYDLDVGAICDIVDNIVGRCVACDDGSEGCIPFSADRVEAVEAPGPIDEILKADTDERCVPDTTK